MRLLIDEVRQLGKEALHDWAVGKEVEKVTELIHDKGKIKNHIKKKFMAHRLRADRYP